MRKQVQSSSLTIEARIVTELSTQVPKPHVSSSIRDADTRHILLVIYITVTASCSCPSARAWYKYGLNTHPSISARPKKRAHTKNVLLHTSPPRYISYRNGYKYSQAVHQQCQSWWAKFWVMHPHKHIIELKEEFHHVMKTYVCPHPCHFAESYSYT